MPPIVNNLMEQWECNDGIEFLEDIGVRPGDHLVDFGCRVGHYSIPAALLVDSSGQVYAIDTDRESLNRLATKARRLGLANVRICDASDRPAIAVESCSANVVLLYDVLHYFDASWRKELLHEAFRVLVPQGLLSVYPKHTVEDTPGKEFKNLSISDVQQEIQSSSFRFTGRHQGLMSHDDELVEGSVLNFRKRSAKRLRIASLLLELSGCLS